MRGQQQHVSHGDDFLNIHGYAVRKAILYRRRWLRDSQHGDVSPTRIGLRYVNVIDRDRVENDTGRPTAWADLLNASFLQMPAGLADLESTRFAVEIASEMPVGAMTLRYGLLPSPDGRLVFRLDVDRYREETFDVADVENTAFVDDVFQVFMAAAGERLLSWMKGQR